MKEKILKWLESTGYPLELFVHKTTIKKGYICEKSQMYTDIETGIAREIDLVAYKNSPHATKCNYELELLVECKKSEKPLVVLSNGSEKYERWNIMLGNEVVEESYLDTSFAYSHLSDLNPKERSAEIGEFSDLVYSGYSIVPAFGKSDVNIYKGIMGLSKAAEFFREDHHKMVQTSRKANIKPERWLRLQIPVIVVDSLLFTAYLDERANLKMVENDWATIVVRMPWVIGRMDSERLCVIQVVTKSYFERFLSTVENFHSYISSLKTC